MSKVIGIATVVLAALVFVGSAFAASTPPQPGRWGTVSEPGRWGTSALGRTHVPVAHTRLRVRR